VIVRSSTTRRRSRTASTGSTACAAGLALAAALSLAACGTAAPPSASAAAPGASSRVAPASPSEGDPTGVPSSPAVVIPPGVVGAGCAEHLRGLPFGAASVARMSGQLLVPALAEDPSLTSVVAAISGTLNDRVDLVGALDAEPLTVFAPVDSSFATVPPATLVRFKTDRAFLTRVLNFHLVHGRLGATAVLGRHTTVQGSALTVAGTPEHLTVAGRHVVCGGIRSANAVIYLIDGWLQPPD